MLRVHHLNCTTMCPFGGRLMDGRTRGLGEATLVCHCLLIETDRGLVMVDTGFGLHDVLQTKPRLSPFFLKTLRPHLVEAQTAVRQIQRLGFQPDDVRHILLTHLDFDHAGGLDDFPNAKIHLLDAEQQAAFAQVTPMDRRRYRPRQWSESRGRWVTYPSHGGEPWFGFDCVRELEGLPPEILMVPLGGHTPGHAGIAVLQKDHWLLHAGDAYFFHKEMSPSRPRCTPGLRFYQRMMEKDRRLRLWNQRRLRQLVRLHGDKVRVFCAHDALEYEELEFVSRRDQAPLGAQSVQVVPRDTEVPRVH
jgi:glyoxylase-like metal-dependent hydrolase (beta-lactamase superfamily II)